MTTETKVGHTPGPWIDTDVDCPGPYVRILGTPSLREVARVHIAKGDEEGIANANLILAAPSLLEALESIFDYASEESASLARLADEDDEYREAYEACESALEKAVAAMKAAKGGVL